MVSRGQGYTLLPQLAAESVGNRRNGGRIIPMAKPVPVREISMVHRRGHLKQKMMQLLRTRIEANLPKTLPRERSRSFRIIDLVSVFR
jgi:DNA-binding transcriptional LysR family regulator